MPRTLVQSPDPKSHIKTLMRIGYTMNSAVADIIDNSIAASATEIEVYAPPSDGTPIISILDNGCGMSPDELIENMRLACKDPDEERQKGDLGRFGSGMKTASFSQARELTVITKSNNHDLVAARWDIDKIKDTNTWCLDVFEGDEVRNMHGFRLDLKSGSGTQIIWRKLIGVEHGSHAKDYNTELATRLAELKTYIALHFHRFMSGPDKRAFCLNNTSIKPVDPFMTRESGYQEGPSEKMRCKGGYIEIRTHVLPHFRNMKRERLEELGGASGIAQKQGLYIYREKRLISAGGWLGMSRNSQLGALARVQVDIPSSLDNDWSTDVKKASLQIPPRVKRELRKFLADPVKRSKKTHRYRGKLDKANGFWKICEDENTKVITYQIDPDNDLLISLVAHCGKEQRQLLIDYLRQLATQLPINHIYEKMSDRPKDVGQETVDMSALDSLLDRVFPA